MATDTKARPEFLLGGGEMGARIRAFDWAGTPLGPIEFWPQSLKTSISLILTSRHPMWIGWGPEMTFLYNDAYLHVLGSAKHPQALGRPAAEVWSEIWDVCGPLADKVFQSGEATFVDDVRLFMDRGDFLEETFYSFSYSPIHDEFSKVSGLFCPSTDITPKILNARRLRTLSELASSALAEKTIKGACAVIAHTLHKCPDDIPFALLYLADTEGKWARLEQAVGRIGDDLSEIDPLDLANGSDTTKPWPIAEVFRTSQRQIISVRHIRNLPLGVGNQPVRDAVVLPVSSRGEHKPYGVLVAGINPCRPLDEEHLTFLELLAGQVATSIQNAAAVEEAKKRADMLAEIDRVKTAFFSNVSHEFRTPLTLMLGPLESLLAKPDLAPEDHENLAVAHRNSLRLLKLVNSLLDFSRIEAGRIKASYVPTDLSVLTRELASNFRSAIQATGIELIVDCAPLPEPVYADVEMWEKIVLNLLSNAFKFTFEGTIALRLRPEEGHAVLTVSDTGTGIPEAELPQIFDRFHRIEGARGRTHEGTGIGLALVQELVKLHGGSVFATSQLGTGSEFTIRVPFGTVHLPKERLEGSRDPQHPNVASTQVFLSEAETWLSPKDRRDATIVKQDTAQGTRPRILLADDNADMRDHVTHILGQEYEIFTAQDGQQALELVGQHRPDLVLTDVMMPRLDGLGLLRTLRADPSTATIPVIFLSARAGEEMRIEGLHAGADDYLVKPFTANELRARIGTHVQMAIMRRQATEREAALRAEAETLNEVSSRLSSELDLQKVVQTATDAATKLTGAKFGAFFYNVLDENGESYLLYTLAGAPREAFSKFGLPRNTAMFEPTFRGTRVVRSHDILEDPNYGKNSPHYGMPHGHLPVRSYLAVPVVGRSGEVLGGLFFGHPEPGIFTERAERLAIGIASHAAIAVDNARLFAKAEQEIARRKQAEIDRGESEERFRAIVETTPECVKVVASDGRLLHMNSSGLAMIGAQRAEAVIGKSVYDLVAPEFREAFRDFNEGICRGEKGSLEFEILGLHGERRRMETHAVPLRDPDGSIVQLAITRDITERVHSERATLLLRSIVDSSDDAIISKDLKGTITSWNKGAERLFGYTADELIGRSITILIPPDRLSEESDILSRLQRGERTEHFETIRRCKDGSLLDISLTISPIKDARGNVIGASKIARNITGRKLAEAALLASESRFRQLADSMPQMVWTARPDGFVDYYNEQWYRFTGFDRSSFGDLSWEPILHPDDFNQCRESWYNAVTTGQPYWMEYRFWDQHEDRWRWFIGRALPVRDENGNIVKWFGTCTDIDEQKRVQEELRHANQDLEQFAYSASHDLQEPLRGVKIYSELLTKRYGGTLEGQALEFLHYLREGASRMEMLVHDLLTYTQVTKIEAPENKTDANEALADTLANLKGAIMESGVRITFDPLPSVPVHDAHLKQLFQNLLGNAIKYRNLERIPTAHVSVERRDKNWLFSVIDNGIGIEPEYKERIFGLFKRLHATSEYPGTGIGLAICQRIVERYHGKIWVESKPGQGSTFFFTVPV